MRCVTEVYLLSIPEISDRRFQKLLNLVSEERRHKILRLCNRQKQCQSLFAALCLRAVLCERLNVGNKELQFKKTPDGKPYLSGGEISFSLSHTDSMAAVCVSERSVGVDIERERPIEPKLAERFFSSCEREYVLRDTYGTNTRFFEVWTRKEAVAKYKGTGFTVPIASIYTGRDEKRLHTLRYNGYVLSVCCDGDVRLVQSLKTKKILNEFLSAPSCR